MKFELLPNEILIECFEYFNAFEIFHSFNQLNSRLNKLIRNITLYLNFQDINKSIFDQFYAEIKSNPDIKDQIYSIHLSDEYEYLQTKVLSFISLNQLIHLRKLQVIFPLEHLNIKLSDLPLSKLRVLSISTIDSSINETLSIINLTISMCYLIDLYQLLKYTPALRCLHINQLQTSQLKSMKSDRYHRHLKQIILGCSDLKFNDLELLLKQTRNLKRLTISASNNMDMIDAYRWEDLITSSLSYLNHFKFKFSYSLAENNDTIVIDKFKQFQTDFWQEQHHWYTEYIKEDNSAFIYTVPYISHTYKRINSSILLDIFKQAPQLSSLTVISNVMKQIFNDKELCKYLNKMIKKLHIGKYCNFLGDSYFEAEEFCKIFSNIEHLQCSIDWEGSFLFLKNHLPKLSTLKITWTSLYNHEKLISRFENEARKLNGLYDIKTHYYNYDEYDDRMQFQPCDWCEIKVFIWFDKNMA